MTWVDLAVIGVLAASALLAFLRGFARELLGIGAWAGAVAASVAAFPLLRPHVRALLGQPDLVDPVTFGVIFVLTLVVLLLLSHWIANLVRGSVLDGLDRILGLVFGLARGAVLVIVAYIGGGIVIPVDRWPPPVLQARALPLAYEGASWAVDRLPQAYRPRLYAPPPGREAAAADVSHTTPSSHAGEPADHD
jgi:membrane protein required for colicin V production